MLSTKKVFSGLLMALISVVGINFAHAETANQLRRNYPGAKDDSDLTVQTLRPITRKGEDIEAEDYSAVEPSEQETNAPPSQGFGE